MMTVSNVVQLFPASQAGRAGGAVDGVIAGIATLVRVWRRRIAERRVLVEVLAQPDSVVADAGWTRAAAMREAGKPFWRK